MAALATGCGKNGEAEDLPPLDLGYPDETLFAEPDWIAANLDDPNLRLLDCSELPTYRRGHLPGASHVWWQDTIELHNPVYGMLVNPDGRAKLAREAGITSDSNVVCYDDAGGTYAARVAWTLRYMGFRAARIMPGGTRAWQSAGHELTRSAPDVPSGQLEDIFDESIVAHPQDILARLEEPGLVFLDTRTADERDETWNGRLRSGTIPGSYWLPRDRMLQAGNVPIPAEQLLGQLGDLFTLEDSAEIIVYGLHGTLAALPYHLILALNRFHTRLYDGSWSQWGADPALPMDPL